MSLPDTENEMDMAEYVLADSGDAFGVLVVVAIVIFNIARWLKKASSGAVPPQQGQQQQSSSIETDLEVFLRRIAGVNLEEAQTPDVQSPPPLPKAVKKPVIKIKQESAFIQPPPVPEIPTVPRDLSFQRAESLKQSQASAYAHTPSGASENMHRKGIIQDLKNGNSIKKAIILREILGPPLALRGMNRTFHA